MVRVWLSDEDGLYDLGKGIYGGLNVRTGGSVYQRNNSQTAAFIQNTLAHKYLMGGFGFGKGLPGFDWSNGANDSTTRYLSINRFTNW